MSRYRHADGEKPIRTFPRLISHLAKINPDLACRLDVQGYPAFTDEHGRRRFRPVTKTSTSKERQKT